MTSSDNLASIEPWAFRSPFADSWISEAFAQDTETLTKALQKSLSNHADAVAAPRAVVSPFFNLAKSELPAAGTQTQSGSASDPETLTSKRRTAVSVNGKPTKRKSRASKRTTTTFITADPANFRQMVQQVTGVRFGGNNELLPIAAVVKPEPQRLANRMQGCLPTLDTSAFLLEMAGPTASAEAGAPPSSMAIPPPALVGDGGAGLDFESFSCFPTLESWKVM
ncbi:hypothetical protein U1Q18_014316 [Sarracenia purpurea var. burkii]